MNELLQNLVKLQAIEFDGTSGKSAGTTVELLRSKIPPQILDHYDRLMVRGKKGVAAVRNQVCTGCHMRVPIAVVTTLMHDTDIQLCENCGRYLYLAAESPAEAAEKPKPAKRGRKPKNPRPLAPTAA